MMATEVTGLVIEAMLKIEFAGIPAAPSKITPSRLTTSALTPIVSPRATESFSWAFNAALPASEIPRTFAGL